MQQVIIEAGQAGQRFDKFLGRHLSQAGMSFIYKMLRKKNITLNGKKSDGKDLLKKGDTVSFFFSDETYQKFTKAEPVFCEEYLKAYRVLKNIEVIYEDGDVIFFNKPAGILSQKAADTDLSANEWLLGYLLSKKEITPETLSVFRPSVCNRLDRNTSGLLLCGKTLLGSRELSRLIKERNVHKYYQLFVKGTLDKSGILEGTLKKDEVHNKVSLKNEDAEGSYIKTGYKPLALGEGITFLEAELFTGKTHQIRAHFASIKHPLAGDYKYGNEAFNRYFKEKYQVKAQLLHAVRVEFPRDCGALSQLNGKIIKAPLPKVFERILKEEVWQPGIPEV